MMLPPKAQERGPLARVWRYVNQLRDSIQECYPVSGRNVQIDHTARGPVIHSLAAAKPVTTDLTVERMVVRSIHNEYLTCRAFSDLNTGFTPILVAKPANLRVSTWDGQTIIGGLSTKKYAYLAENSRQAYVFDDLTQLYVAEELQPKYQAEPTQVTSTPPVMSIIYALKPTDGTGVTGADYIDMNVDARNFVANVTEFHLCIGNVLYRAPFHSGPVLEVL